MDPAAWGVDVEYFDARGKKHRAPDDTINAVLEAMGATTERPGPAQVRVVQQGAGLDFEMPAELQTEDGDVLRVDGQGLDEVPLGYHRLTGLESGDSVRLIVVPRAAYLPQDLFAWGWAIQLYALRSASSWGIGNLGDLRRFNRWADELGAGFVLINPLHSVDPTPHQDSPYFPGSRCWRNPIYIEIDDVPGAAGLRSELAPLAREAQTMNGEQVIRRLEVWRHQQAALEILWRDFSGDPDFESFKTDAGELLDRFAIFLALLELHGGDWRTWPAGLRNPESPEVARASSQLTERVDFFKWQQWVLDRQLQRASQPLGVVHDLATGINPVGFDSWMWQNAFASRVSIGAPPDDFNLGGQDWGVMAFDPHRLRAEGYEPFVQTVRSSLRHAAGLRIDHVMGLWRLFWIPEGAPPSEGTYVRYPTSDLLGIVALESHRAAAYVIGEDLGNVEPDVRELLAQTNMLSYRLLYFEEPPPDRYPRDALAAVTNHDLPTLPGLWSGADLAGQLEAGVAPNADFERAAKARISDLTGIPQDSPAPEVVAAVYALLARAPSRLIAATLEDALGMEDRPNLPGTVNERPNWSLPLPSLEEIQAHAGPRLLAKLLGERR